MTKETELLNYLAKKFEEAGAMKLLEAVRATRSQDLQHAKGMAAAFDNAANYLRALIGVREAEDLGDAHEWRTPLSEARRG